MNKIKIFSISLVISTIISMVPVMNVKAVETTENKDLKVGTVIYNLDEKGNIYETVVTSDGGMSEEEAKQEYYEKFIGSGESTIANDSSYMIINESTTLKDVEINQDVYINKDCTLIIEGKVAVNGSIYVFGDLMNQGELIVNSELYCLNYFYTSDTKPTYKAGNYSYGNFFNKGTSKIKNLIVEDEYLKKGIPSDIMSYSIIRIDDQGNETIISSFDNYNNALTFYNSTIESDKTNNYGIKSGDYYWKIKYGIVKFKKILYTEITKDSNGNNVVNQYVKNTSFKNADTNASTYINVQYGFDAAYLDTVDGKVKFKISGVTGIVDEWLVDIVPYVKTKTKINKYYTTQGKLYHSIKSTNFSSEKGYQSTYTIGYSPKELQNNVEYYSYDAHYFYDNYFKMIDDYRNNKNDNAVNKDPYYNYYQYLPFHSQTNYSKDEINNYIGSKYSEKPTSNKTSNLTSKQSLLFGEGEAFVKGNETGVNPLLTLSVAINESGWGRSSIALSKNNIFGLNAVDSNPQDAADTFNNVADCVNVFMQQYITHGYLDTKNDSRYYGGHLGDKASGMNVKYASDPYWGEKAAAHSYSIDEYLGKKDFQKYSIGIKISANAVNVYKEANTSSNIIYTLKNSYSNLNVTHMPVILLDKTNNWYKIYTDHALDENRNRIVKIEIGSSSEENREELRVLYSKTYNFDYSYGYVDSSKILKLNEAKDLPSVKPSYDIDAFLSKAGITLENGYITNVKALTTIKSTIEALKKIDSTVKVEIDSNGHKITNDYIGTDMILKINTPDDKSFAYTFIIKGDLNSDGKITAIDLLRIEKNILSPQQNAFSETIKKAADLKNDNKITAIDLLRIEKYILDPVKNPIN